MPDTLSLPQMICFALYSANHAMQRAYQPLLADLGLTYPQYLVLVTLDDSQTLTVGDLGRALQLDSNTLTPLLKRMEAHGFVTRNRARQDERQVHLALTAQGRALRAQAVAATACVFDGTGHSLETLHRLRDAVVDLRDRLRSNG